MGFFEGAMDIDLLTEIGPTEETVEALMEYLVGPLLPLKHTDIVKKTPPESQQKAIAKQVHAAAVLYNYYHLNQHREKELLKFDQFCNLAIMFKPSILHHMKYMRPSDRPALTNPETQLSITEKAIMDACNISESLLNFSTNVSAMIKEWPITKVAVLLIDSKKENCFLKFNDGVWSAIEKDLYPDENWTGIETKKSKKRKLSLMKKYDEEGEVGLQQLAFSAVKEEAGINNGELKVLESHDVYSLRQAKTATRFYIVQSTKSIKEDNMVPIQDAIFSLQGPVVKNCSGSWAITPVVEYYYLLPYADILSNCFLRESNGLPHQVKEGSVAPNIVLDAHKSSERVNGESKKTSDSLENKSKFNSVNDKFSSSIKEEPRDGKIAKTTHESKKQNTTTMEPVSKVPDNVITPQLIESPFDQKVKKTEISIVNKITGVDGNNVKGEDTNGSCGIQSNNSSSGADNMVIDKPLDKSVVSTLKENQITKPQTPLKVYRHEKKTISIKKDRDLKKIPTLIACKAEKVDGEKKPCIVSPHEDDKTLAVNHALVSVPQNNNGSLEDFQFTVDAKRSELSESALRALLNKRQKLCNQQHYIESELALCDKKIQAIKNGGIGDCLGLKLEAVIDCCNEICQQNDMQAQVHTNVNIGSSLPLALPLSGKTLSEAQLTLRKACQELDDMCLSNNWMLPTYHTTRSDSGFVANVSVKGTNFECSGLSGMLPSVQEARNSAATHAITKLQQMASEHNSF